MGKLAEYEDILPLALHVDYWDYIGWKDTFAQPAYTNRQKSYAGSFGTRSIYTPQMVIGGVDQVVGSHAVEVMNILHRHQDKSARVDMKTVSSDTARHVRVVPMTHLELPSDMRVQFVRFIPNAKVDISRGENAGRSITSTNVVTDLKVIGTWDGQNEAEFELPLGSVSDGEEVAVILQAADTPRLPGRNTRSDKIGLSKTAFGSIHGCRVLPIVRHFPAIMYPKELIHVLAHTRFEPIIVFLHHSFRIAVFNRVFDYDIEIKPVFFADREGGNEQRVVFQRHFSNRQRCHSGLSKELKLCALILALIKQDCEQPTLAQVLDHFSHATPRLFKRLSFKPLHSGLVAFVEIGV